MDNKIPVILVHKGNTFYLKPVLEHIRLFNPDTRICLLSDASTKGKFDFVEHYNWKIIRLGQSLLKLFMIICHLILMSLSLSVFNDGSMLGILQKLRA